MPLMKGFSFEVLSSEKDNNLITSLHGVTFTIMDLLMLFSLGRITVIFYRNNT